MKQRSCNRKRPEDKYEGPAWDKADAMGIHPYRSPLGYSSHVDFDPTPEDLAFGRAISWYLGDLQIGSIKKELLHPATAGSPVDQWVRVARALRIHGLKIVDRK